MRERESIFDKFPHTQERELSTRTSRTSRPTWPGSNCRTKMPTYTGTEDALTRLLMAEKVMIICAPRRSREREDLSEEMCRLPRQDGQGKGMFLVLVGQYTNHLQRRTICI